MQAPGDNGYSSAVLLGVGALIGAVAVYGWKSYARGMREWAASSSKRGLGGKTTSDVPGRCTSAKKHVLEAGANALQSYAPISQIHLCVCGVHHYAGEIDRQVEAHHFCSHINEDVHQCVIYDSSQPNARLIGVEYIVSEKIFQSLPEEEKKLWHSHQYEVKSGLLVAPGIPESAEDSLMEELVNTYGKTFHTWQIDRHILPYGMPQLMMSFTQDGEINQTLIQARDNEFSVSTEEKKNRRQYLDAREKIPGADHYHNKIPELSYRT